MTDVPDKPPSDAKAQRAARLAAALRVNLKRRKAPAAPLAENDGNGSSS